MKKHIIMKEESIDNKEEMQKECKNILNNISTDLVEYSINIDKEKDKLSQKLKNHFVYILNNIIKNDFYCNIKYAEDEDIVNVNGLQYLPFKIFNHSDDVYVEIHSLINKNEFKETFISLCVNIMNLEYNVFLRLYHHLRDYLMKKYDMSLEYLTDMEITYSLDGKITRLQRKI